MRFHTFATADEAFTTPAVLLIQQIRADDEKYVDLENLGSLDKAVSLALKYELFEWRQSV